MKKFAWIIALLAALSLTFFGCTEPDGSAYTPPRNAQEVAWTVIFDMTNSANGTVGHGIQDLALGELTFDDSAGAAGNPISPVVKAGNMPDHISSFKAVAGTGGRGVALQYVTVATWGPGFDLPASAFSFLAGDKIKIIGSVTGGATIDLSLNRKQGDNAPEVIEGSKISEEGDFEIEVELTGADVAAIWGNQQKVLRFEDRVGGSTVTINNIVIEGNRPINPVNLEAPKITLSGDTVSWDAVEFSGGYDVFAGTEVIATVLSGTSLNLSDTLKGKGKDTGIFSISVKANGVPRVSTDSPKSDAVNYAYYFYKITTSGSGVNQTVTLENPRFTRVSPAPSWGASGFTFETIEQFAVKITTGQQANFGYVYPSGVAGFDVADYDFAEIELETTGTISAFSYKSYPSINTDAAGLTGSLASDSLSSKIKFEIKKSPNGLIFQKYSANTDTPTIKIKSVTFSKAVRYKITFDSNGGSIPSFAEAYFVNGTQVGNFFPTVSKAGQVFLGWFTPSDVLIGATTTISSSNITADTVLRARWKTPVVRAPQTVDFSSVSLVGKTNGTGNGARAANLDLVQNGDGDDIGYTVETIECGYGNAYGLFEYVFTDGAEFSDFNKITFKYKGVSGDIGSKTLFLIANDPSSFGGYMNFSSAPTPFSTTSVNGSNEVTLTLTINQSLAAVFDDISKTSGVGFAFGLHAGDYKIQITEVVFSQD